MTSQFPILIFTLVTAVGADLPRADLHVHLDDEQNHAISLKPAEAASLGRRLNVRLGILAEGGCAGDIRDAGTLQTFLTATQGQPLWRGMQVYGFDWRKCLPADLLKQLDYIAADALVFPPPGGGKAIWLWLPGVKFDDPQRFMEQYVDFNERVLSQRIDVWANPTYVPESLKDRYDELWTPGRMDRLISAAVRNNVAIEINAKFQIPSTAFIRRAKAAGARFSFGSNAHMKGMGEIDWCLRRAAESGLTEKDIFLPKRNPLP